ncbi:MAG: hypothetical protein Q4A79_03210 [Candidatus Saccharibacteria bacterium]|nr:hypothetical protein [Candidatus Saccharibacteria bacterium]
MRIGIDLDGVVFDSEREFRVYSELYDEVDLKRNSKLDNRELKFQNRLNWTQEETEEFLRKYHKQIIAETNYMPGAQRVLKMLKQDGHKLIVVTARGGLNKDMIKITEERFKQSGMDIFDKYYWATENKDVVCKEEKIDVMIDDSYEKCRSVAREKIRTIYFKDAPSFSIDDDEYIKTLYNWGEIYRYIRELSAEDKLKGR